MIHNPNPEPIKYISNNMTDDRVPWTQEEDDLLVKSVQLHQGKNWKMVAASLTNRTRAQCAHRWQKVLNPDIKKGAWSDEEDTMLNVALEKFGPGKWSRIAREVPGRNGKQCRERWHNHLMPEVKKDPWSQTEDELIVKLRAEKGNKWAAIARYLPGRTENAVKNRWNAKLAIDLGCPETPRSRKRNNSVQSNTSIQSDVTETMEAPQKKLKLESEAILEKVRAEIRSMMELAKDVPVQVTNEEMPMKKRWLNKLNTFGTDGFLKTKTSDMIENSNNKLPNDSELEWLASLAAARALSGFKNEIPTPSS